MPSQARQSGNIQSWTPSDPNPTSLPLRPNTAGQAAQFRQHRPSTQCHMGGSSRPPNRSTCAFWHHHRPSVINTRLSMPDQDAARRPVRTVFTAFLAWKTLLLLIAAGSLVGGAYDTSASLALDGSGNSSRTPTIIARLTSWDAVYFTKVAHRGYLFEQEWAFGSGLPIVVSSLIRGVCAG
jgi:hypothetical protein